MNRLYFLLVFSFLSAFSRGQDPLDSLWSIWVDTSQPDTVRIQVINKVIWKRYLFTNPDTAFILASEQYKIAEKHKWLTFMAQSSNTQGACYAVKGDHARALGYYLRCLDVQKEMGSKHVGSTLNNIGLIYKEQEEYDMAMEYFNESYAMRKEQSDTNNMAIVLNNISLIYKRKEDLPKALEIAYQALSFKRYLKQNKGIATSLINIGEMHYDLEQLDSAFIYFTESLKLKRELNDLYGASLSLVTLGDIYIDRGDYANAIKVGEEALDFAQTVNSYDLIYNAANLLQRAYRKRNRLQDALEMYDLYHTYYDSVKNEDNSSEILKQRLNYEHREELLADSIKHAEEEKLNAEQQKAKDAEIAKQNAEIKAKQNEQYLLYGGLSLVFIFALFIFNRFRVTRKQRDIIELQKQKVDEAYDELEEKNTEILDSINYAKRIQSAILPPNKLVKEYISNSFILYKPKDIVAGDFYWLEPLQQMGTVLFAAADCTGHGVPGAMVSVVCNNGLNRSVREHGLTDPGKILDKTREIVISEFEKSEEEVKDGMDIALCSLNGNTLKYAGAHNPLWIIRKGADSIEEIKANKQPIGKFDEPLPYTTHMLALNPGDCFYIFSDGYADQFGGEKGKKFKAANFKRLLLSIQNETMERQCELIDEAFENWKGTFEQLDDVCVIGVRI